MTEHDQVVELLTWFVNGSLAAREQDRVAQHLERCAACRTELAMQQRLRAAIAQPAKVEFAPQPSFNKLWDKISAEEAHAFPAKHRKLSLAAQHASWLNRVAHYWMPITLAVQLVLILGLLAVLSNRNNFTDPGDAAYRTVTRADPANDNRPIIHVVFDAATRLADVKDILSKAGLEIASGPTTAGVYSLTLDNTHTTSLSQTVIALRADPRVRFAELSHP